MDTMNAREVRSVIRERHWKAGNSLREIERELGLGKSVLSTAAKRHGVRVRTKEQQVGITNRQPEVVAKRAGDRHWCFGKKRPDSAARMLANNPMNIPGVRERAAEAQAEALRAKPTRREARFLDELAVQGIAFEFQRPEGRFIIDFAFAQSKVALEIDGKNHQSDERASKDARRDAWLVRQGWTVLRYRDAGRHPPSVVLSAVGRYVPGLRRIAGSPCRILVRDRMSPEGRIHH